jgi:hypothetical protein
MTSFVSWPTISALSKFRVAKYKQRKELKSRPLLEAMPNVQIGGCTGLSFGWTQRIQLNPSETASKRIAYMNTDQAWRNIDYFADVFNNLPARTYGQRVAEIAPHACGMKKGVSASEMDPTTYATAIQHIAAHPGYHMVIMALRGAGTNHVCAMRAGGDINFFDPNSGEYKVSPKNLKAFFLALTAQYATYISARGVKLNITFSEVQFHHIG